MDDFLRKIKVLDSVSMELNVSKMEFVRLFEMNVDESDLGFSDSFFEAFSSSKNEYKGNIDADKFRLRRRQKLFDTNKSFMSIAMGSLVEKENKLIIEAEIKGISKYFKFFFIAIIFFYSIFIISFTVIPRQDDFFPLAVLPFILMHALFMLGIPYFIMKRSVSRLKYDLERDFHFWTK
jgi:hypothetical protein